ncbi:MAG: hypothetical protein VXU42_03810 [Verrucomicrobiota bacterium]|nr:hypothetical protein [Verrucomicrobiota bacterium]
MPVPTPLEYGELLDGADLAEDGNGEETELVLEILHCWPPTCRGMASRSCPEKGEEVEPALSPAQPGAGAATIRANWPGRQALRCPSRPDAPRQASRRAWPAAGIDYRQGNYGGASRGCHLSAV